MEKLLRNTLLCGVCSFCYFFLLTPNHAPSMVAFYLVRVSDACACFSHLRQKATHQNQNKTLCYQRLLRDFVKATTDRQSPRFQALIPLSPLRAIRERTRHDSIKPTPHPKCLCHAFCLVCHGACKPFPLFPPIAIGKHPARAKGTPEPFPYFAVPCSLSD